MYRWFTFLLSNGPDKKERTKCNEHIGMHKGAIFNFGSTTCTLLIGLNIKFYEVFAKQPVNPLFSNKLPYDKSLLSQSNTEILCVEHVKL